MSHGSREQKAGRSPSQRQLQVGETLRKTLSEILIRTEWRDEALHGISLSVTEVSMSPDMRTATAYVIPLGGGDHDNKAIAAALEKHHRFLRGQLARGVRLKYMPDLHFRLDESFDRGDRIDALLRTPRVARDLDHDGNED